MRLRTVVFALILLSFAATFLMAAEEDKTGQTPPQTSAQVSGIHSYGVVTLDTIQGAGLVKLNGTSVQNALQLTGSLIANNAEIGSIEVSGEANLTDTTIHKGGFITGSLRAVRSSCQQPLILLTQKAVFTASRFDSLTFRQDSAFKGKQTLELKQGTIINGSVVFEGGKGEIILFPGSQVLGPITGGKIIRKS
jgi:hypothetical protein